MGKIKRILKESAFSFLEKHRLILKAIIRLFSIIENFCGNRLIGELFYNNTSNLAMLVFRYDYLNKGLEIIVFGDSAMEKGFLLSYGVEDIALPGKNSSLGAQNRQGCILDLSLSLSEDNFFCRTMATEYINEKGRCFVAGEILSKLIL